VWTAVLCCDGFTRGVKEVPGKLAAAVEPLLRCN